MEKSQKGKTQPEKITDFHALLSLYFPEGTTSAPFPNADTQWDAWSRFVDLCCMILLMQKEADPPQSLDRIGCLLADAQLVQALEPHQKTRFSEWESIRKIYQNLMLRGEGRRADGTHLPLWAFLNAGLLSPIEGMAFLFAFCAQKSRKYERIFGVLQEQEGIVMPTVGLTCDLCSLFLTEEENSCALLLDAGSYLNRILLDEVRTAPGLSGLSRPLLLGRQTFQKACGRRQSLGESSAYAAEIPAQKDGNGYVCPREEENRLFEAYAGISSLDAEEGTGIIFLEGEDGLGKSFLMQRLGYAVEADILCVYADRLLSISPSERLEIVKELARRAIFEQEFFYLKHFPESAEGAREILGVLFYLRDCLSLFFLGGKRCPDSGYPLRENMHRISLRYPDAGAQKRFWESFAEELYISYEKDVNLEHLVSKYNMTPGRIRQTLLSARLFSRVEEDGDWFFVGKECIEREVRSVNEQEFGEYAVKLSCPFEKKDLQLTAEGERLFSLAMDRVRLRSVVLGTFGFGKKLPYGSGTSIVFYGPPGTGKTMAAQVFARELGLDIYRIDLSQVENKYIGETSKNLGKIFDAAKHSNAVLFFDEADSLFAKRTEVSNSNDKHANAQTAYLLQKIEEYDGVSVLATNIVSNFDAAFKRRMTFLIPIEHPNEEERLLLWKKAFPKETPLGADVNFDAYARLEDMTGSMIKSAAVSASYYAAARGEPISHFDILDAIDEEVKKTGKLSVKAKLLSGMF